MLWRNTERNERDGGCARSEETWRYTASSFDSAFTFSFSLSPALLPRAALLRSTTSTSNRCAFGARRRDLRDSAVMLMGLPPRDRRCAARPFLLLDDIRSRLLSRPVEASACTHDAGRPRLRPLLRAVAAPTVSRSHQRPHVCLASAAEPPTGAGGSDANSPGRR